MANPYQYTGSGQGFLTDYSGLAAAGSAVDAFSKAYGDAQDKSMKRQETQAQIEAIKTKMQREKEQSAIEAYKGGASLTTNPDGTVGVGERPLSSREQEDRSLKGFGEGAKIEDGTAVVDKTTPKYIQAVNSGMRGQATQDRSGFMQHKAAVGAIADDKETKALLGGYQAIQNAVVNFKASGGMPQEFHQLQTALRLNAGSGNRTGVEERSKGYAHDWGISKDEAMQIMTGNIQDVALSSPKMVKAIEGIAEAEIGNKQQQASQQIAKKSLMFRGVYDNPAAQRFEPAFNDTLKSQYGQFGLDENGKTPAHAGLVKPGLVAPGLAASQSGATQAAPEHPEANAALVWAKNPNAPGWTKEKAQAILQRLGQ